MKTYIVIPAYNEEKHLQKVLAEFKKARLPIVVVDDGSHDKTLEIAKKAKVIALRHKINLGKGAALKTGCEFAFSKGAEAVITVDADGQHEFKDLKNFTKAFTKYDVILGSRNLNYGVPLIRFLGNKVASVIINIFFGVYVSDLLCGYRAFTKTAYKNLRWTSSGYGVETEMVVRVAKNKLKFTEVPVTTIYYDKVKGVTILDALEILADVIIWRIKL